MDLVAVSSFAGAFSVSQERLISGSKTQSTPSQDSKCLARRYDHYSSHFLFEATQREEARLLRIFGFNTLPLADVTLYLIIAPPPVVFFVVLCISPSVSLPTARFLGPQLVARVPLYLSKLKLFRQAFSLQLLS